MVEYIEGWVPCEFPPSGQVIRVTVLYTDRTEDNGFWWSNGNLYCMDPNKGLEITHYKLPYKPINISKP